MNTNLLVGWRGPDGAGFWYTFVNMRVLNVRAYGQRWQVYIDGDLQSTVYKTRLDAQDAAVTAARKMPELEMAR